ncbi:DUF3114 domain-containing protein [Streptococcus catagoni]|uniref:DUF3114 domain-containing protein n=1 Tax=Streptococcus catagoni TaxID=2654874 RepID=UPI0014085555|nr:DUF3114 domain-containing protein [Streptococcus catagoni]
MSENNPIINRYKRLSFLSKIGWTKDDLALFQDQKVIDYRIGSPIFYQFWQGAKDMKEPKQVLKILLDSIGMPLELSGDLEETQTILSHFDPNLSPDAPFWSELAALVDKSFPGRSLEKEGPLEKRLHQFRYIISSQQAQYIRSHFKREEMTDAYALAEFLKTKKGSSFLRKKVDYSLKESARLHNKLKFDNKEAIFPDQEISYNIKLLIHFHTEFILDSDGNFLNEVDAEKITERGLVNGASFNYGTDGDRHWDLDVSPISQHDPSFRNSQTKGFHSPKFIHKKRFQKEQLADFDWSYFNPKGYFARNGRSSFSHVRRQARKFRWKIRYLKLKSILKKLLA